MRVATVSSGTVMWSVKIKMPVIRMTTAGTAWPINTSGFLRMRSEITPPMGDTMNMPIPDPIWARPAAALLPVI